MTDERATERFYQFLWPHAETVLRTARILTGSDPEADDLAQETMLKAFRAVGSFRDGTDARAWLLTILRNARIDRARSRAAAAKDVSLDAFVIEPVVAEAADAADAAHWERPQDILASFSDEDLIEALQKLPEEIRWTLLLVDVEGLDQHEAAQVLGVPVGTVKSRSHRGRSMLRAALLPLAWERRWIRGG